jgi:hypothetical protein
MRKPFFLLFLLACPAMGQVLHTESFDADPDWDGLNNRSTAFDKRTIEQDFGYASDVRLADSPGAIGGLVTPIGVPAYYAKPIPPGGFDGPFSASGTIRIEPGAGNTLFGFFNTETINEWRTPNAIVFRVNGRGDISHVHFEYATSKWRAGAGVIGRVDKEADRAYPLEIPNGGVHTWSLEYDPAGAEGRGEIVATFDDVRAACPLTEGHKADGVVFNHFGILNVVKHADSPGTLWLGDLTINGKRQDLSQDPQWDSLGNRTRFESGDVRPRFDIGYSATNYAGGNAPGEIGGLFFRGDCRYPEKLAYYGAPVKSLTLDRPIHAEGKLTLRRGVTDSTTLFGFFHSKHSVTVSDSQKHGTPMDVLGFCIEGPSSEGFFVYPVYRTHGEGTSHGIASGAKLIYPDGAPHAWAMDYLPPDANGAARIRLTVDETSVEIRVEPDHLSEGATFDRFGFVTPWIDGNGQVVYFDDLIFTAER